MLDNIGIHRAEDVYIANLMGALEAINAGITMLLDWSHVNNTLEHADAAIEGLTNAGIRAVYAHGVRLAAASGGRTVRGTIPRTFGASARASTDDQLLTLAGGARAR
jgi:cytosine/adenosine deaminase-related metal-dependent hydrolase